MINDSINLMRNIKTTGTITPSSRVLIKHLLSPVDFNTARCIVELGPGNGCITRALLQRMHADSTLLCFELNPEFATRLSKHISDPRLHIHNTCASALHSILAGGSADANGSSEEAASSAHSTDTLSNAAARSTPASPGGCADYVISSLPLALLDDAKVESILSAIRESLCPGGHFLQYQYSLAHYADLKSTFSKVHLRFTIRNMPPAFVYDCLR